MMHLTKFMWTLCLIPIISFVFGQQRQCGVFRCKDAPPGVANGVFTVDGERRRATLHCNPGFDLTGQATIACGPKLQWSPTTAVCLGLSGNQFLTVFPRTVVSTDGNMRKLLITTNGQTNVNITNVLDGTTQSLVVNDFAEVSFPTNLTLLNNNNVNSKVVVLVSDKNINVQTFVSSITASRQSQGSFFVLPTEKLCMEYILITTAQRPQFNIIAHEDDTDITINLANGGTIQRSLNKNQVYTRFFNNDNDFTGTLVTSTKNVAVFSGGYFSRVPSNVSSSRDLNVEQLTCVNDWKRLCIMGPFKPRNGFLFKVVASQDDTLVSMSINGVTSTMVLNRGQTLQRFQQQSTEETVVVMSDKPVLVAQFSLSRVSGSNSNGADASMVLCVPPEDFLGTYRFYATTPHRDSFLRIVIRSEFKDDIRLNGAPLTTFDEINVMVPGGDPYVILYVEVVTDVYYVLQTLSGEPLGADLYGVNGFGFAHYAHNLGRRLD